MLFCTLEVSAILHLGVKLLNKLTKIIELK